MIGTSRPGHEGSRRRLGALTLAVLFATASFAPGARAEEASADPWGSMNRGIFRFNDALDRYALEPVAKGYHFVTPDLVERWLTNFFTNLWFPVVFTNCVLQAKPHEATQTLARFMLNTTVGIGGFGDPATKLHVPAPNEDFGQTLGYWGVRPGPYLVLPFFGPSDIRDTFGRAADSATRVWPFFVPWYASTGPSVVEIVNNRARYLEEIADLRASSVDYYASVRDAYLQRRSALVEDRVGATEEKRHAPDEEDLYFPGETEGSNR